MQLQIQNFGHFKKNRLLLLKVLLLVIKCLFFVFFRQNTIRPGGSYMNRLKIYVLLGIYKKGPLKSLGWHKTTFASFVPESEEKLAKTVL